MFSVPGSLLDINISTACLHEGSEQRRASRLLSSIAGMKVLEPIPFSYCHGNGPTIHVPARRLQESNKTQKLTSARKYTKPTVLLCFISGCPCYCGHDQTYEIYPRKSYGQRSGISCEHQLKRL